MILVFWMLSFKPAFSLSPFTFIKSFPSFFLLSAIRVVSSAYLRLLIFLLAILISACASSSPTFLMMYSAYKLNKQGDNIQPWRSTPLPIWVQSVVPCPVLTIASWPAYRFPKRQVKEESEKAGLKLNIQKAKIMAPSPITSRQADETNWKQWQILLSWAPKSLQMVSAAMKLRHLLPGRKAMTNLDSILKSRDITLPTKVCIIKAMVFPVVMYGRESWTIKKAECQRIDAFELWC